MKRKFYCLTIVLALALSACSAVIPAAVPTVTPTIPANLPQTEADVPRITAQEAKAAVDSGKAVIIDVRATESFLENHIAGAVSIPLTQIEGNPARVTFDKTKWLITYCT